MYAKKQRDDGTTQVTGGKRLKSSGAYTPLFGKKVATLFRSKPGLAPALVISIFDLKNNSS